MHTMVRLRSARWVACWLMSILAVPYLAVAGVAAPRVVGEELTRTVVLFPLSKSNNSVSAEVVTELQSFLRDGIAASQGYRVVEYSPRLPIVERLVNMQPDTQAALTGPFSTDAQGLARATSLGKAMMADLIVVGSVERYSFSDTDFKATVSASVELLDGSTGTSVRSIRVTGQGERVSPESPGSEAVIASEAVKDAGRQIVQQITGDRYRDPYAVEIVRTRGKDSSRTAWIPWLLLSLGVGLLIGGSGSDNGSGDSGLEPPPPPPF